MPDASAKPPAGPAPKGSAKPPAASPPDASAKPPAGPAPKGSAKPPAASPPDASAQPLAGAAPEGASDVEAGGKPSTSAGEGEIGAERARADRERAAHERQQPRPPLPDIAVPEPPRWRRHLEVGGDFAVVARPFTNGLDPSSIGYNPAVGWGVHLRWPIFDWLRFHAYFLDAHHGLDIPQGALAAPTSVSISPAASIDTGAVETFSFGGRLAPTWPISERLRAWVSAGIGWGRFNFPVMTVTEPGGHAYEVQDRSGVFVEFPLGIGASFDVIERWLAIELESTIAPVTGQSGDAYEVFQAIDADGEIADVGPFGAIEASFVNTVGLSLIL